MGKQSRRKHSSSSRSSRSSQSSQSRSRSRKREHSPRRSPKRDKYEKQKQLKQIKSNRSKSSEEDFEEEQEKYQPRSSSPSPTSQIPTQQPALAQDDQPKYKIEQTRILLIQTPNQPSIVLGKIEQLLNDTSIAAGTSLPDEIEQKDHAFFAKYPSIESSTKVYQYLGGQLLVHTSDQELRLNVTFYPLRKIDLQALYDWYCDKCEYKNFARRERCYRCENQKSERCKLNYSSQPAAPKTIRDQNAANCSIMVRGSAIMNTEEEILLELFQAFAPVKDIRLIKSRMPGVKYKDFAFIEFFTPDQTIAAMKGASASDFRVMGEKVTVMYSRNKSDSDYTRPLPYERRERGQRRQRRPSAPLQNYYKKHREHQIEQERHRPLVTIDQLKQKREQQLKKNQPIAKEMTAEQLRRREAEEQARLWERDLSMQLATVYICPLCARKFKNEDGIKNHQKLSKLHEWNMREYSRAKLLTTKVT